MKIVYKDKMPYVCIFTGYNNIDAGIEVRYLN